MKECLYCKRSFRHDGKCSEEGSFKQCLIFERDPRGRLIYSDNQALKVSFGMEIPERNKPCDHYSISGISKTITILKINNIQWRKNKVGALEGITILADIKYWSDENGIVPEKTEGPRLVLCK